QTGSRLPLQQDQDDRDAAVARLAVLVELPAAQALFADQQDDAGGTADFIGKLLQPIAAAAQALGGEENVRLGILAAQDLLERLHEREVLRVVAEKPVPHLKVTTSQGLSGNS